MSIVYVQNIDGRPLAPTARGGHVRHLLEHQKATVVERNPFTIKLLHDATADVNYSVRGVCLGLDPGRTNIGASGCNTEGMALINSKLTTRNKEIPQLMRQRKIFRALHRHYRRVKRQRRAKANGTITKRLNQIIYRSLPGCKKEITCKLIKNKKARFNNRARLEGWLNPTVSQLLETHLNFVKLMCKYVPVSQIALEVNKFYFMALEGQSNMAINEQQKGQCLLCKRRKIEVHHHMTPLSKGGSDTLPNIAGLCKKCHHLVHTDEVYYEKLKKKKQGINKKFHALSVVNQMMPYLIKELEEMFPGNVILVSAQETAAFREKHKLQKEHCIDAFCVANIALGIQEVRIENEECYEFKQFRRHNRRRCHKENADRWYYLDGKKVARNRHKRSEQKDDSLSEYREKLIKEKGREDAEKIISKLTVKKHLPQYRSQGKWPAGSVFLCDNKYHILEKYSGFHNGTPDYLIATDGKSYRFNRCTLIKPGSGIKCIDIRKVKFRK